MGIGFLGNSVQWFPNDKLQPPGHICGTCKSRTNLRYLQQKCYRRFSPWQVDTQTLSFGRTFHYQVGGDIWIWR